MIIEIKTPLFGWKPATKDQAIKFSKHMYHTSTAINNCDKLDFINTKVKGIIITMDMISDK